MGGDTVRSDRAYRSLGLRLIYSSVNREGHMARLLE